MAQSRIYTDLAVIGFSQLSTPLPGNANGLVAFFRHARFVQQQAAIIMPTKKFVGIVGNLIDNQLLIPGRMG